MYYGMRAQDAQRAGKHKLLCHVCVSGVQPGFILDTAVLLCRSWSQVHGPSCPGLNSTATSTSTATVADSDPMQTS